MGYVFIKLRTYDIHNITIFLPTERNELMAELYVA